MYRALQASPGGRVTENQGWGWGGQDVPWCVALYLWEWSQFKWSRFIISSDTFKLRYARSHYRNGTVYFLSYMLLKRLKPHTLNTQLIERKINALEVRWFSLLTYWYKKNPFAINKQNWVCSIDVYNMHMIITHRCVIITHRCMCVMAVQLIVFWC